MAKSGVSIILGIALTIIGAAALALAMVLQRYALSYPEARVPFMGLRWPKLLLWFVGLLAYALANGLYAAALNFGPLSLLACVFTLLLVFNMIFARWFLGELLTPPKVAGCLTILAGVLLVVVAAARDAPTEYTPEDIEGFLERVAGLVYLTSVISIVVISVGCIIWYDCRYPSSQLPQESTARVEPSDAPCEETYTSPPKSIDDSSQPVVSKDVSGNSEDKYSVVPPGGEEVITTSANSNAEVVDITKKQSEPVPPSPPPASSGAQKDTIPIPMCRKPPAWLDDIMSLLYPGSLGLDEGIAHLSMKGAMAMFTECSGVCSNGVFWLFVVLWVVSSVATSWWLKVVFARYETTSALPIEYGVVNLASVCSGLIFYRESDYMETWQIIVSVMGLGLILAGIQCSRLHHLPCQYENGQPKSQATES